MKTQKGSILIFTLWVLIILAILSIILSYRASSDVKLAKYESDSLKATYLAKAGVLKMLAELVKDDNPYGTLNEDWNRGIDNPKNLTLMNDTVLYGASDENRRLNLNSPTLDRGQLVSLGIDDLTAQDILDYKGTKGAKGFEFIEELFLVDGVTRDIFLQFQDYVTIYRGDDSKVNINTAGQGVLEAVVGDSSMVLNILEYRRGQDGEEGTEDDGIFKHSSDISMISGLDPGLFTVDSDIFRIWAQVILVGRGEIVKRVEAVVDKGTAKIYHWKEY